MGGWTILKPWTSTAVGDAGGEPGAGGAPLLQGPGAACGPADGSRALFCTDLQPLPFQRPPQAEKALRFGDGFLDTAPTAQSEKEIIDTLDFIKIKDFGSANDQVNN